MLATVATPAVVLMSSVSTRPLASVVVPVVAESLLLSVDGFSAGVCCCCCCAVGLRLGGALGSSVGALLGAVVGLAVVGLAVGWLVSSGRVGDLVGLADGV